MSNTECSRTRAMLERLFREGGLEVSDEVLDRLAELHRRDAAGLARLSRADLGETEPAIVFAVETSRLGSDHERD